MMMFPSLIARLILVAGNFVSGGNAGFSFVDVGFLDDLNELIGAAVI